ETQTETVAAGASETSGVKGPFSTLRDLDPKLIGIAVGALFLIFVFPAMLKKLKGKTKRDLPSPATIIPNNAQERVSESDASSLPEEPVSPPLKEPEPVTSISALNQGGKRGGGEGEEGEEKEEVWVPLESVISSPAVESPQIENDIDESPEESLIDESDRDSTEEPFEELDVQSPSDDLFYEEPKVDLDSVIEGGDPLGLENETKGSDEETPDEGSSPPVEKPDRRMMEDLFDALEKTAEARLAERSEWSQASEPDETDELKTDDLAEPEVSLDSVFGFDPDISQFLEESPDIHPPDDSADSTQEDAETAEREPLNQPPEDERWEEPEHEDPESFQIQVGSGYEDSAGESSDLWDDPENDTPTESLQESLEDDSAPLQYSNGKHEPYDQTVGDVNDKSPASQRSDGPEMPNKTLNASDEDEDFICPMTGVFSRTFFDKQFPKTFDRCRRDRHPLTLVLLGIDHFEDCPGDDEDEVQKEVLTSVAESLRKSVRTRDILARFDRSTFAVLMLQVKPTSAFPLALKIRNDLKKLNVTTPEGFPVDLTLSFGMNCVLEDDRATTREELLEGAWESLCRAAMEGGNQIVLHGIEGDSRL
ncbi:MAG: diguanylate cyclase, partial [Candidatus Omnitrophica bacterium]|nr:diguanylate cyclase [Candidatus Omnitrophota bacterium]